MKMKTSKVNNTAGTQKLKHLPERTCIACRTTRCKRDLVRLACTDGLLEIDIKGKKPGRGVYLCPIRKCWDVALKGNRIEYGLRTRLSPEDRSLLFEYSRYLPDKENAE